MKKLFLNDRFILSIIILNCVILFVEEMGYVNPVVVGVDVCCIVLFFIEMVVKHVQLGVRGYWSNGWNCMDGILVLIALPSLIAFVSSRFGVPDFSVFLVFRGLRLFRFFKVIHLFPHFSVIMRNFVKALRDSASLFAGYLVVLFLSSMVSTELCAERAPEYFGDPLLSFASTFRLFKIEGWYEIPDAVCAELVRPYSTLVYAYFVMLLVLGGIVFMSLLNSVFVDAMVSDNNDEILEKLENIEKKLEKMEGKER